MPRPWSAAEITATLATAGAFLLTAEAGFLIGRVIADEAELLTLAVAPPARRAGTGQRLVEAFLSEARARGAAVAFLEVAADNAPALALYLGAGFAENGRRPRYYLDRDGSLHDALVMACTV